MESQIAALNRTVRAEMARAGETQTTLAPKISLSQSGLSRHLAGDSEWTYLDLVRLSEALGLPLGTFMPEQASA